MNDIVGPLFCEPHLERAGRSLPAEHIVNDEAFCADCFRGKPVSPCETKLSLDNEEIRRESSLLPIRSARYRSEFQTIRGPGVSLLNLDNEEIREIRSLLLGFFRDSFIHVEREA